MDIQTRNDIEQKLISYMIHNLWIDEDLRESDFDNLLHKSIFNKFDSFSKYDNPVNWILSLDSSLKSYSESILEKTILMSHKDYSNIKNILIEHIEQSRKLKEIELITKDKDFLDDTTKKNKLLELFEEPSRVRKSIPLYTVEEFEGYCNTKENNYITFERTTGNDIRYYKGALSFIAGRPGNGKTALMLSMLLDCMIEKKTSIFITYEQTPAELILRLIAQYIGYLNSKFESISISDIDKIIKNLHYIDTNKELIETVKKAKLEILNSIKSNTLILIQPKTDIKTLEEIIGISNNQYNPFSIFIDYIQKITNSENKYSTRQQEIANTSNRILQIALRTNIPIILGAQLNRETEKRKDDRIYLSDLRESGDIEQDANLILAVRNLNKDEKPDKKMIIHVIKNRNGQDMTIECKFNPPGSVIYGKQ